MSTIYSWLSYSLSLNVIASTPSFLATDDEMKIHLENFGRKSVFFTTMHSYSIVKYVVKYIYSISNFLFLISNFSPRQRNQRAAKAKTPPHPGGQFALQFATRLS